MARILILVFWTVSGLLVVAEISSGAERAPIPSVGVFLDFDARPGNSSVRIMEKEVDQLIKPSGIHLDWRSARDNDGTESFSGVVVVKFKGRCRVEGWSETENDFGSLGETVPLGWTAVKNGRVLPFSEVECDQVRKALAYMHPGSNPIERQNALGLALGRVVAHELFHILAHTTAHAGEGLAKATHSLVDLVNSANLGFRKKDAEAMRNAFQQQ